MTLKTYIWGIRIITLLSFSALVFLVIYVDPEKSAPIGATLFFLIAFFVLGGIFNLFLLFARRKLLGAELAAANVGLSFRQGILLSVMTIGILILQSFRVLVWWDALLVVAAVFLIELYFLSRS
jgi:hypothetical protein